MSEETQSDQEGPEKKNWLYRLLQLRRSQNAGDTIAAQIDTGASNVAVGKNIIQIGSIKIPRYLAVFITAGIVIAVIVLSIMLMLTSGIFKAVTPLLTPTPIPTATPTSSPTPIPTFTPVPTPDVMPSYSFNVAVAELNVVNQDGTKADSAVLQQARDRSSAIAHYLREQLDQLSSSLKQPIVVWGPDQHNIPKVVTEVEAMGSMKNLHAEVLIYGDIDVHNPDEWQLLPKFYVDDQSLERAKELVGPYALGSKIPYRNDSIFSPGELNSIFQTRLEALIQILIAVAAISREPSDYSNAAHSLEVFLENSNWGEERGDGQEILYHFLGSAYLGEALASSRFSEFSPLLQKSLDAYTKAVEINPLYARAYNGLGSVYYVQAVRNKEGECVSSARSLLLSASQAYSDALSIAQEYKHPLARVDFFSHYGLGTVAQVRGNCATKGYDTKTAQASYANAIRNYRQVVEEYKSIADATLHQKDIAIYAYGYIAGLTFDRACNSSPIVSSDLLPAIQNYAIATALIHTTKTKNSIKFGIQIMPTYLTALCKTQQAPQAVEVLAHFMNDLSTTKTITEVQSIRQQIQVNVNQCRITWKECTDALSNSSSP